MPGITTKMIPVSHQVPASTLQHIYVQTPYATYQNSMEMLHELITRLCTLPQIPPLTVQCDTMAPLRGPHLSMSRQLLVAFTYSGTIRIQEWLLYLSPTLGLLAWRNYQFPRKQYIYHQNQSQFQHLMFVMDTWFIACAVKH